jgi:hypothetical protein
MHFRKMANSHSGKFTSAHNLIYYQTPNDRRALTNIVCTVADVWRCPERGALVLLGIILIRDGTVRYRPVTEACFNDPGRLRKAVSAGAGGWIDLKPGLFRELVLEETRHRSLVEQFEWRARRWIVCQN